MLSEIKGSKAKHCIITPGCRTSRGDDGALQEAFERIRQEYEACVEGWKDADAQPTLHLVLMLERPNS